MAPPLDLPPPVQTSRSGTPVVPQTPESCISSSCALPMAASRWGAGIGMVRPEQLVSSSRLLDGKSRLRDEDRRQG
jgi:hypothetical protein